MSQVSKELREKRANRIANAREYLERANKESRDMTTEENTQFEAWHAEAAELRVKIEQEERQDIVEAELRDVATPAAVTTPDNGEDRSSIAVYATPEYRDAFCQWAAFGHEAEIRALATDAATKGQTLVPEEMFRGIVERLAQLNAVRSISTVISTESTMPIPIATGYGAAAWTDEAAAYNEADDTFSEVTLNAHKSTRIIKVSEELLQDERVGLLGHLTESFARSFNELEETAFTVGDGSSKPTGVVTSASAGVTVASTTAITADELKTFKHSLKRQYRAQPNTRFLMSDNTVLLVDKLVIATEAGNYIWRAGLEQNTPDTLLGVPVVTGEDMADAAAGTVPILYGDFSFYWIGDRGSVSLQRLNELYAANGQVGFRAHRRVDGILTQTESIKKLSMAAS